MDMRNFRLDNAYGTLEEECPICQGRKTVEQLQDFLGNAGQFERILRDSGFVQLRRLKDEDIVCHLENENTITTAPFLSPIFGGIKLMVPETQVTRALEILKDLKEVS